MDMYAVKKDGVYEKFFKKSLATELFNSGVKVFRSSYDIPNAKWSKWVPFTQKKKRGGHALLLSYPQYRRYRELLDLGDMSLEDVAKDCGHEFSFVHSVYVDKKPGYEEYRKRYKEALDER